MLGVLGLELYKKRCMVDVQQAIGKQHAAGFGGKGAPRRSGRASATSMCMGRPSSVCRAAERRYMSLEQS